MAQQRRLVRKVADSKLIGYLLLQCQTTGTSLQTQPNDSVCNSGTLYGAGRLVSGSAGTPFRKDTSTREKNNLKYKTTKLLTCIGSRSLWYGFYNAPDMTDKS